MLRINAFKELCTQYPYQKLAQRISESEFDQIVSFIEDKDALGHLEFEYAVNRMFLGAVARPKNWTIIQDLLIAANSKVHIKPRSGRA